MKRTNKKAFTIVELVIVIAVVVILAAVLIPTFASLVKKAQTSKDTQLIRNLNTALAVDKATGNDHNTMTDALKAAKEAGYDVEKINASNTDNEILWDGINDAFCYLEGKEYNKENIKYLPEMELETSKDRLHAYDYWKIYKNVPEVANQTFSIYLGGENYTAAVVVKVGFDAGENTGIPSVTYEREESGEQKVVIRTNNGMMTVDSPNDTITHYNGIDKVVIKSVAEHSYYEKGNVAVTMEVKDGHVVIEPTATVKELNVPATATANAKVEVKENSMVNTLVVDSEVASVEVEDNAKVENVVSSDSSTNVIIPESVGATKSEKTFVYNTAGEDKLTLKGALDAGKKYIVFAEDITVGKWSENDSVGASITYDVTIDGDGHKLTTSADRGIWIDNSNVSATIKNLELVVNGTNNNPRGIQVNNNMKGVKLLLDNVNISKVSHYGINVQNNADVELTIINSHIKAWGALNLWSANYKVRVDSSVLEGINDKGYDAIGWNNFATIVLEGDTTNKTDNHASVIDVIISNSEILAKSTTGNKQAAISFHSKSIANRVVLNNTKITLGESNCYSYINNGEGNELIIDGVTTPTTSIDINELSFDLSGLVIANDKMSATGTVIVTYGKTSYNIDLTNVINDSWSNGTDYLYTIDTKNSLVCIGIYISYENGEDGLSIDIADYVK